MAKPSRSQGFAPLISRLPSARWLGLVVAAVTAYIALGSVAAVGWSGLLSGGVRDLPFSFGPLVETLASDGRYAFCDAPDCWRAARMPALPSLLALLTLVVGGGLLALTLVKNLVLIPLVVAPLVIAGKRCARRAPILSWVLVALVLSCPPWVLQVMSPVPEESLLIPLLTAAVAILLWGSGRAAALGMALLVALLALTKSGGWLLAVVLCVATQLRLRSRPLVFAPWLALGVALLAWSAWVAQSGGPFAPITSLDGYNLHKGNNTRVLEVYPDGSLDQLSPWLSERIPKAASQREWDSYRAHEAQAIRFWHERPLLALRASLAKAWVYLVEVDLPVGTSSGFRRLAGWVAVPFLAAFRLLLAVVIWRCFRALRRRPRSVEPWLVLAGLLCAALPSLVGFAYQRHALVLFAPLVLLVLNALAADPQGLEPGNA